MQERLKRGAQPRGIDPPHPDPLLANPFYAELLRAPAAAQPPVQLREREGSSPLLRSWRIRRGAQLFIAGGIVVALIAVGVGFVGRAQITSMISNAGDSIVLRQYKVHDDAEAAQPQIALDDPADAQMQAHSLQQRAEEASRLLATIAGLEAELRAKTAAIDSRLQSQQPLTPATV